MITDFIKVYDDAVSVEYCEKFIGYIEHYIENSEDEIFVEMSS